jgi:rhombotail lipoprotein
VFLLDDNHQSYSHPKGASDRASEWRWDVAYKETIVAWGEQLKTEGILSDMFVISEMIKHGNSLIDIRQAAALQGADAVLVLSGVTDIDRYQNVAAALYITIVGTYFIPGTHIDSLFIMNGALWDVRNQYLYLAAESEGIGNTLGPLSLIKSKPAISAAKKNAIESFRPEFLKRIKSLKAQQTMANPSGPY